jgi:ABC-type sugar transport system ATPase subunit
MDEPTARLAPHERERLFDIRRRLAASGVGIIYISHFLEEVEQTAATARSSRHTTPASGRSTN